MVLLATGGYAVSKAGSNGIEQRRQAALAIQGHQVVASADMGFTNKNLRHRAPPGQLHHLRLPPSGRLHTTQAG